jgi:hypothetical protein
METMFRRSLLRCASFVAALFFLVPAAGLSAQNNSTDNPSSNRWTRKYKTPPQAARIQVTILKDDNGKPVENAAVIFHPIEGDKDKGYLELKSNEDGKATIDVIPIGDTVRLQVIANGFQTYGGDYKVDKPEISMEVRLKRPGAQYSIYKNNGATASKDANSGSDKAAGTDKSAPPAASSGQPAQDSKSGGSGSSGNASQGSSSGQGQNQNQDQNQSQSQNQKQSQPN